VSKKHGVSAVKTWSGLDPNEYLARCQRAAQLRRFHRQPYGEIGFDGCGSLPLVAFTRRTPGLRPRIYFSTGIHGDEPAGPEALLQLLEQGEFDDRANWFLAPLLNPTGFVRRTRENADAIDLNRDYRTPRTTEVRAHVAWLERQPRFDLALCLHEDWEATGFYLYELNPTERPSLAPALLAAARQHMSIDPATVIDGRPVAEPGIIRPDHDPKLRDLWAEAIYLYAHHTSLCYTVETPSSLPLAQRVTALAAAVRAALQAFLAPTPLP
jgi:murein peptide amidase A